MIVTSVQIKTAKTQKHLYCPVFTIKNRLIVKIKRFFVYRFISYISKLYEYILLNIAPSHPDISCLCNYSNRFAFFFLFSVCILPVAVLPVIRLHRIFADILYRFTVYLQCSR